HHIHHSQPTSPPYLSKKPIPDLHLANPDLPPSPLTPPRANLAPYSASHYARERHR
ncbi:Hypothetical predicted protein, partial [Prunus dulcis]